ncbi:MAG: hypothetical protein ACI835_003307 [Planctomycetota bacterium]
MPVWHDITKEARESELVTVIGITQEQHPDRCQLFAQWQEFDWPILWDPFNLTGASSVPIVTGVDEFGRVTEKLEPRSFEDRFLYADFPEGDRLMLPEPAVLRAHQSKDVLDRASALAKLMWGGGAWAESDPRHAAIAWLEEEARRDGANASAAFELGVAYRLRYDLNQLGQRHRPLDFQDSLDAWRTALALDQNQYIWRRRIQQYGPRLDKPYPFYDWVERAKADLVAKGKLPTPLLTPLTGSELASGTNAMPTNLGEHSAPDPGRKAPIDKGEWIQIESAVATHTGKRGARVRASGASRIHLVLRPNAKKQVHWGDEAGATLVWVATPRDWRIERNLYTLAVPDGQQNSGRARTLDFEIVAPQQRGDGPSRLRGYVLYYVCEGEGGKCAYFRQDFEVSIPLPESSDERGG